MSRLRVKWSPIGNKYINNNFEINVLPFINH